ncbi:hypothetical protein E5F05_20360 [Deinococcus metallilatus]|uniref:Uncharacterized protein n=1 Tax=Deinococcus metallilatus TaxID=1211322 RepID=A0AAJ5K3D8_9DEIO|nr:hypothetical protein [Deinococcus metallilatus]MBB5297126.1 hypothetical protein [Deinococcus metallilatus]QBY10087.1 hypothetical protein E5F05_20360 [Deinococcus metallilatus]RXJ08342.1 hypothetical protein ERJ73_19200 [Deinococcus metallilatus]TLK21948.1 hypothetical protein FCS05_18285 [Deinococcus metallilatus]GMA17309.1 hypothetical protein GCM10025871_36400 [Deinococcus metallilatus]
MKSNTGRKVCTVLIAVFMGALTLAKAGGALDFGQRGVAGEVQVQGGALDFGQRGAAGQVQAQGGPVEFGDR